MDKKELVAEKAKMIQARAAVAMNEDEVARLHSLRVIATLAQEIVDICEGY